MIRLRRQDARRRLQIGGAGDERRGALVRGDADILEQEGGQEEILFVGVRVERLVRADQSGGARRGGEGAVRAAVDVDRGLVDEQRGAPGGGDRAAQRIDVRDLVIGDLARQFGERAGSPTLRPPVTAPRVPTLPVRLASGSGRPSTAIE